MDTGKASQGEYNFYSERDGQGTIISDYCLTQGFWKEDRKHGPFVKIFACGDVELSVWDEGVKSKKEC
jgi:hypothetical protein